MAPFRESVVFAACRAVCACRNSLVLSTATPESPSGLVEELHKPPRICGCRRRTASFRGRVLCKEPERKNKMRKDLRNEMRGKMRLLLVTLAALLSVSSCGDLVANSRSTTVDEWLKSEHSLMKKRITFLERENAVLANENSDHVEEIEQLKATVALLQSELGSWKAKYLQETESLTAELRDLLEQKASFENETAERIQELEAIQDGDRRRSEAEIETLNEQLRQQREAFNLERENMRNEAAKKQASLAQRIEGLGKDLTSRDAVIESLKTLNEELSRKYENSLKEVGEKTHSVQLLQEEIRKLKGGVDIPRGDAASLPSRTEANGS